MVDLLLEKLPLGDKAHSFHMGCSNPMDPLCLAVLMNDAPRVCWLVKRCHRSVNSAAIFLPDIPTYYEGLMERGVGSTEGNAHPLHLAVYTKRLELVR